MVIYVSKFDIHWDRSMYDSAVSTVIYDIDCYILFGLRVGRESGEEESRVE